MKPLMMLSLPNSGSTWLAGCIAETVPDCRYAEEFFHPMRNERHELVLRAVFGCELVSCYRNIVMPGGEDVIRNAWIGAGFNFTKDVFSPFKLEAFLNAGFDCFVLLRAAEYSFPPTRLRVWSFYEHAWWALRDAGYPMNAFTMRGRAIEAHGIMQAALLQDARRLGVPVLWTGDLMTGDPGPLLRGVVPIVTDATVERVMATRRERTPAHL